MKKLCLIRPAHKTDHPMGTESAGSIDTLTPIIILLRQGRQMEKGTEQKLEEKEKENDWHRGFLQLE